MRQLARVLVTVGLRGRHRWPR